jgi:hypothetical protein
MIATKETGEASTLGAEDLEILKGEVMIKIEFRIQFRKRS